MPDRNRTVGATGPLEAELGQGYLELLGVPTLHLQGRQLCPIERKTAGLLAYLCLEGAVSRSKLAGLLWPESSEATARNNLAQALRRLRQAAKAELVWSGDVLELRGVAVDVALLQVAHFAGRYQELAEARGTLLEGCDYDDCPDFDDWLRVQREKLAEMRKQSLLALSQAHEQAGQYREALAYAQHLLSADPISEVAHRLVVRLLYLLGDRSAALAAYARCEAVLAQELGVAPLPETQALRRLVEQGETLPKPASVLRKEIPLSLLRPPERVGREAEWLQMETALAAGRIVLVSGPPGVGKSRLTQDFVQTRGPGLRLEGRPGDRAIPYATLVRMVRRILEHWPALQLPAWMLLELARLLPELGTGPGPIEGPDQKLRFLQALAELVAMLTQEGIGWIVLDDLQFVDAASQEALQYLWEQVQALQVILVFRAAELRPEVAAELQRMVQAGYATQIELGPLDQAAVVALLQSLDLPQGIFKLAPALYRHTGGNVFFILETLRSLWETDHWPQAKERLPVSRRISALIKQRLERLSPEAQRLVRAAAVAGGDFSLELAAKVLQTQPLELLEPLAELEAAQLLEGNTFTHDLLYEATLEGIPASIRAYLHRQVALELERQKAEPAQIARHWLQADPVQAVPHLWEAARRAETTYQFRAAAELYEQAASICQLKGDLSQTFDLLEALSQVMVRFETGSQHALLIERLQALAQTPDQQARAWLREAIRQGEHGFGLEAERAARAGLACLQPQQQPRLRIQLLDALAQSLYVQRKTPALIEALEQLRQLHLEGGDPLQAAICTSRLGIAFDQLERHREALAYYQEAEPVLERSENRIMQMGFHHNRAVSLAALGLAEAALEAQLQAGRLLEGMQGVTGREVHHFNNLALRYYDLERYAEAQQALERALEIVPEEWGWTRAFSEYQMARLYWVWGVWDAASDWLNRALSHPDLPPHDEATYCILGLLLAHPRGEATAPWLERLDALFAGERNQAYGRFLLAKARILPDEAQKCLEEALALAQEKDLPALQMAAHTLLAQALLHGSGAAQRGLKEAQAHAQAAMRLLETYRPTGSSRLEVLWVHCCVQAASRPADHSLLEQVLAGLLDIAEHQVPVQHQQSYLHQNPLSQAILRAARRAGIPTP